MAGALAPTPSVEEEPIATMVKGLRWPSRGALRSGVRPIRGDAGGPAPTPGVEEEPIATMVKGLRWPSRVALRSSVAPIADSAGGTAQLGMPTVPGGSASGGPAV